ncbi:WD40/YVTN/BNR-like repeat-containing protein [Paenibacillus sp. GCM10028914]|uniref:WD40/YVTN/BNR-like repeat-containing protein n=1 Tax=Paenibacillus sp. GCM10028914 TaxID=3273416 RepID=UPI0036138C03
MRLRNHSYSLSIVMLFILIMIVAACSSDSTPAPVERTVIDEDTESVEDGQTLTVVTTIEEANNTPKEQSKYQIQTRLTDFYMFSESKGIAWGLTKTSLRLYLTEDFGETWVNISPSSNINFAEKLVYGRDIFFTDRDHGWIVRNAPNGKETILLNTVNGGKEWKLSSLPDVHQVTALSFASSERGWVMTAGETSPGSQGKALFRTNDNGGKWTNIMQNTDYPASRTPANIIPRTGHLVGMNFANSYTGLAVVKETKGPKLYITRDGGTKWSASKDVFQDSKLDKCQNYIAGTPQFLGSTNDVWIPVSCFNKTTKFLGYFSSDSGNTWKLIEFPLNPKESKGTLSPVFRTLTEGWTVNDGIVYHTKNMGKTWTPFPADPDLTEQLDDFPIISKMQFASSSVGWMLVESADGKRSRLLQSINGGETWRVR